MADVELQKAQEAQQAGAELQEKGKDVSKLLSQFGGFNAIRGFMPDADNMNPARKAAKDVFLKDKRFKDKRENLKREISRWLELLDQADIDSATYRQGEEPAYHQRAEGRYRRCRLRFRR